MAKSVGIRVVGNNLVEFFNNGAKHVYVPTTSGMYVRAAGGGGVPTGAGGGEDQAPNPNDPPNGSAGSITAPVDDYPYPNAPQDAFSPFRYSYRDCTDFAAWRINRDLGDTSAPWMYTWGQLRLTNGDAIGWKHDWELHGWEVSSSPRAGMLGWFGSKAGAAGHVCYIQAVSGSGRVTIEEYNWQPYHQAYNKNLRQQSPGDAFYPDAFLGMPPKR